MTGQATGLATGLATRRVTGLATGRRGPGRDGTTETTSDDGEGNMGDGDRWRAAAVFMVRQAGFPFEMVTAFGAPDLAAEAAELLRAEEKLRAAASALRMKLPTGLSGAAARLAAIRSLLGQLKPLPGRLERTAAVLLGGDPEGTVAGYRAAAAHLVELRAAFAGRYRRVLDAQRADVVSLFRDDPRLRDMLLLSNAAAFEQFNAWLNATAPDTVAQPDTATQPDATTQPDTATQPGAGSGAPGGEARWRRMADLLAMYLQRATTKNETNSHFGPVIAGGFEPDAGGVRWGSGPATRRATLAHWAAEEIGRVAAGRAELSPSVRPRRRPLALRSGDSVHLFAAVTATGTPADWRFGQVTSRTLTAAERWLFDRADGELTLAELHEAWPGAPEELARALAELRSADLVVADFEIPVGEMAPLAALRAQLPPTGGGIGAALDGLDDALHRFEVAEHPQRARLLAGMGASFEALTGVSPNRHAGRHYADRGLLYEECHAAVDGFVAGGELHDFVTGELAVVYDLLLAGPRHRMSAERELLAEWFEGTFGAGRQVPLVDFYRRYLADRDRIAARCAAIDEQVAAIDRRLVDALLGAAPPGSASLGQAEVVVPRRVLDELRAELPRTPGAVCNPDVMFAARDPEALAAGDFLAVVGDCHAMREVLTHTSVSGLLHERAPKLVDEVMAGYRGLLDPDEVLCDVVRSHLDKTDAQLDLPVPDVEFHGRSRKHRDAVISPADLRLSLDGGRVALRAAGSEARIRLAAPPATGPSIARDPLAAFSFPRFFGGLTLRGQGYDHLPRFRCGRLVLQREIWRLSPRELTDPGPAGTGARDDAAGFQAVARLRARRRLPRRVYAKIPGQPKPVFVDLESPLLVRQLLRLSRGATGALELSEMLPGPQHLWLTLDGRHYTSEVRCAVFS